MNYMYIQIDTVLMSRVYMVMFTFTLWQDITQCTNCKSLNSEKHKWVEAFNKVLENLKKRNI